MKTKTATINKKRATLPVCALGNGNVSPVTISKVMAALGRRNKGKRKAMTSAERQQRRNAGKASAQARGFKPRRPKPRASAGVLAHSERKVNGVPVEITNSDGSHLGTLYKRSS